MCFTSVRVFGKIFNIWRTETIYKVIVQAFEVIQR